jgi:hypothetical protein
VYPRLALNLRSSCLSFPSAWIICVHHYPHYIDFIIYFAIGVLVIYFGFFLRIFSLYGGDSLQQFQIGLYCTLVRSPHHFSTHPKPLSTPLEAIARGFFVIFQI